VYSWRKLATVLKHVFSRKTIGYILLSLAWTMIAVMFWTWLNTGEFVLFESLEITITIMTGKLILYGFWDWLHLKEPATRSTERLIQIVTPEDPDSRFGEHCVL
jgi:hypothetical protein